MITGKSLGGAAAHTHPQAHYHIILMCCARQAFLTPLPRWGHSATCHLLLLQRLWLMSGALGEGHHPKIHSCRRNPALRFQAGEALLPLG